MPETEMIDLNKRTQKELILEVYKDIKSLRKDFDKLSQKHIANTVEIATIRTQIKMWAIFWGSVSALIISLITFLIENGI